jgi:hypothetical protein
LAVLVVLFLAAALFVAIRLTLVLPATAAEGKVRVFETWGLTKGQFWRILGAMIIASAPSLLFGVLNGGVTSTMGEEGAREGVKVLDPAEAAVMALLSGLVVGVLQAPLYVGLQAFLYRGLRQTPPVSSDLPPPAAA